MADPKREDMGKKFREMLEKSANNPKSKKIALDILDKIFEAYAKNFPKSLGDNIARVFNGYAQIPEEGQDIFLSSMISRTEQQGGYSPTVRMQLPFNAQFAHLTTKDIRTLPGYIKLHEAARDMDIAVGLFNILGEDQTQNVYGNPPILVLDVATSYEDGAFKIGAIYPDLPKKQPKPKDKPKGEFDL